MGKSEPVARIYDLVHAGVLVKSSRIIPLQAAPFVIQIVQGIESSPSPSAV